ncbi:13980_t:CDS:2 [Cetraspora pellucida]|uniref:13980_t:CDS:1 n=1 Tax=Cetraspora pellucida TaxID=1433469 RepID=A0A9N9DSE7_9GLOM|nr:13980_t:CDS:2 [Cetraspora pellucida]
MPYEQESIKSIDSIKEVEAFYIIAADYLLEEVDEELILINWPSEFKDDVEPQQNENEAWNHLLNDWWNKENLNKYFEQERHRKELIQQLNDEFYKETTWAYWNEYFSKPEVSSNKYNEMNIAEEYKIDQPQWNINIEEEMFYGFTIDPENSEWLLLLDNNAEMDWEY